MNKLVRDKIPEIMKSKNKNSKIKIIESDLDYLNALNKKLLEEANEYVEISSGSNDEQVKQEIADILEVIEAICKFKNYDNKLIQDCKLKKKEEKGGFEKRVLLILED